MVNGYFSAKQCQQNQYREHVGGTVSELRARYYNIISLNKKLDQLVLFDL